MSDLMEFLLARIAEDKSIGRDWRVQRSMGRDKVSLYGGGGGYERILDPARVLAECEAKRRIVDMLTDNYGQAISAGARDVLRALALPYAGHPDYREEWRP